MIANRLGSYVDPVFNRIHDFTGLHLLLATYSYAFQIYMDFSGYTDMALGSALFFNINLTQNFNRPYLATSIADFWRRWHITFSRWILDYIFKPLQVEWRNGKNWGTAAALVVAFLVSGVWHGARWGFVVWGGLHGLYMACSVFYRPYQKKLHRALGIEKTRLLKVWQVFFTFNLVSFAWIFFRANSLTDAFYIVSNLCVFGRSSFENTVSQCTLETLGLAVVTPLSLVIPILAKRVRFFEQPTWKRWCTYYSLSIAIVLFEKSSDNFIYFRF